MNRNLRPLRDSVLLWFARNLDEELLTCDIAMKWGSDRETVRHSLRPLIKLGWLETQGAVSESTTTMTWRATDKLRQEMGQ